MCLIPASFASPTIHSTNGVATMTHLPFLRFVVSRYFGEIGAKWLEPQWWAYGLYLFLF